MWRILGVCVLVAVLLFALLVGAACRAAPPAQVGPVMDGGVPRLRPCPSTPNCVSSQAADDDERRVEPFAVPAGVEPDAHLERLLELIDARPGAEVAARSAPGERPAWAHAVFVTRWMRFRDDVEVLVDEDERVIHVRSASRVGHSDLGANRARVERLRADLTQGQ